MNATSLDSRVSRRVGVVANRIPDSDLSMPPARVVVGIESRRFEPLTTRTRRAQPAPRGAEAVPSVELTALIRGMTITFLRAPGLRTHELRRKRAEQEVGQ
jgi:hypothetical protein